MDPIKEPTDLKAMLNFLNQFREFEAQRTQLLDWLDHPASVQHQTIVDKLKKLKEILPEKEEYRFHLEDLYQRTWILIQSVVGDQIFQQFGATDFQTIEKKTQEIVQTNQSSIDFFFPNQNLQMLTELFLKKKCKQNFLQARTLLMTMAPSYETTDIPYLSDKNFQEVVSLQFKCHKNSVDLLKIIYSVTEELDSVEQNEVLIKHISDIMHLFLSITHSLHLKTASKSDSIGLTLHNDCIYLLHHLNHMGTQFPHFQSFQKLLEELSPELLQLGQTYFEQAFEVLTAHCIDFFAHEDMQDSHKPQKKQEIDRNLKQCTHTFSTACKRWHSILPLSLSIKGLGRTLDLIFEKICKKLYGMTFLGAEEAEILSKLLKEFGENTTHPLSVLLLRSEFKGKELTEFTPFYDQYEKTADLLNLNLTQIGQNFDHQDYQHFSAHDLSSFIKALFSESEKRSRLLKKIEQNQK